MDLLINEATGNSVLNCDGYKYLLIQSVNDSNIINVDLLKLIGSIDIGFIRYVSSAYILSCSLRLEPNSIKIISSYKIGFDVTVSYTVHGIK